MPPPQEALAPCRATASRRVLVVEDNPDARESLLLLLRCWGHQVEVAGDGASGVQKALDWRPDVAVVDIGLPLLDGYEVARRVRAGLKDKVRLIALTAYGSAEDRAWALASGFDYHLVKAADLRELQQMLETA